MEWSWLKWLMKHDRYLSHDHWSSCFPFLKLKKWNFVASLPAIPSDMEKCRQPLTMWSPGSSRVWRGAKLSLLQQLWRNWSIVPLLLPLKSLTAIWNKKQDWKFQSIAREVKCWTKLLTISTSMKSLEESLSIRSIIAFSKGVINPKDNTSDLVLGRLPSKK